MTNRTEKEAIREAISNTPFNWTSSFKNQTQIRPLKFLCSLNVIPFPVLWVIRGVLHINYYDCQYNQDVF